MVFLRKEGSSVVGPEMMLFYNVVLKILRSNGEGYFGEIIMPRQGEMLRWEEINGEEVTHSCPNWREKGVKWQTYFS